MGIENAPVLNLLKSTMGYLTKRQETLAENVANANTPGYTPRDITRAAFEKAMESESRRSGLMTTASDRHYGAPSQQKSFNPDVLRATSAPDSATTINGNSVVLEDQMTKVAETRMEYEAVIGLYNKSLALIRSAARSPGRG